MRDAVVDSILEARDGSIFKLMRVPYDWREVSIPEQKELSGFGKSPVPTADSVINVRKFVMTQPCEPRVYQEQ